MIREPQPTTTVESTWTFADINTVHSAADGGEFAELGEICDEIARDDRVSGCLSVRVDKLLGSHISFSHPNETVKTAITTDWGKLASEAELSSFLRAAILSGVGLGSLEVETDSTGRQLPILKSWSVRNLLYSYTDSEYTVLATDEDGITQYQALGNQFVLFFPFGESRFWTSGRWDGISEWWLAKHSGIPDWAKHSRLHGSGAIIGKLPEGRSVHDASSQQFLSDLVGLGKRARMVLPAGYDVSMMEASSGTWSTFPQLIDQANTAISIAILGHAYSVGTGYEMRTGTSLASALSDAIVRSDAQVLSNWTPMFLRYWTELNFPGQPPPQVQYTSTGLGDLLNYATALSALAKALETLTMYAPPDAQIDIKTLFADFKIPILPANQPTK